MNPDPSAAMREYLEGLRTSVDAALDSLLPGPEEYPTSIHRALRHSVFAGGKRLRAILCIEAGRLFAGKDAELFRIGAALEMIHTYSLIHDDLPALDNDDLRRGKPACHKAFGEATAILAGDALLTLAFEVLSCPSAGQDGYRLRVTHEVAHAIGTRRGMVGGQVIDLETCDRKVDAATLDYIHSAKTGAFIRAAVRCGAISAGAENADLEPVTLYGEKIGLAFQIVDDLLDVLGSQEELGKSVGKDEAQHKATYPALHGIEASRNMAADLARQACDALQPFCERARTLQAIANHLTRRTS